MKVRPVDVKVVETLGDLQAFTFKVPNTEENRTFLTYDREIDIYYDQDVNVSGVLGSPILAGDFIKCSGKELALRLERRKFQKDGSRTILYQNVSALTIVNEILADVTNFVCIECPTTPISVRFEYSNHLQCLQSVAAALNKDLWFDRYDLYIGDKGSDKGLINYLSISKQETDFEAMRNRVFVTGVDVNKNEVTVMAEVAGASTYHEGYYTVKDVTDETTLQRIANALRDKLKNPLTKAPINISIIEYHSKSLEVGDTVHVANARQGIDVSDRIKRITIKMKGTVKIELGHIKEVMADLYRKLGFQFDIKERSAQAKIAYGAYGFRQGSTFPDDAKDGDKFYRIDRMQAFIYRSEGITTAQWLPEGKLHFEAEELNIDDGKGYEAKVADPRASMGYVRRATSDDSDGYLAWGPYVEKVAGTFMPSFCMMVNNNASHTKIANIQVCLWREGTAWEITVSKDVYLDDFKTTETWQVIPAGECYINEEDTNIETRVRFFGGSATLVIDWIALAGVPGEDAPTDNTNISGPTGVSTIVPGGRVTAATSSLFQLIGVPDNTWTSSNTVTVPNEDHDVFFAWFAVNYSDAIAENKFVSIQIYDTTDGIYYPSGLSNPGGANLTAVVDMAGPHAIICGTITLPKNVKNHGLQLWVRQQNLIAETIDMFFNLSCWGHSPHTHPVDDPSHGHPVDDPEHKHW